MDHFILPPGVQHYITVPYKSLEPYDNGDFYTYPERKGWTADDIEGKNEYGGRKPEEVEAFLQSWLFFGVLVEVFRIVGIDINTDDFIDNNKGLVTTCKLPDLIEEFAIAWKKKWPENKDLALRFKLYDSPEAVATTKILKTVFRVMLPFCYDYTTGDHPLVRSSLLSPEIVVSIMGLATTFFEAGKYLYMEFGNDLSFGGTPLLRSILREKWCPFHVTLMQMELRLDAQYYLAALPGLPDKELKRHTKCTDTQCMEEPADEETYVLKHAVAGCSCQPVPVPIEDLLDIIGRGDTPVVFFHKGDNDTNPHLRLEGFDTTKAPSLPYISISHLWSDGMGNPNRNALPACLLESIQGMVNAVDFTGRESGHEHIGFWMDTLCIPVEPKYDEQRKAATTKMSQIYQDASAMLVIESQLQSVQSTVSLIERCVNLYGTKWARRLWTYHEGGLPKKLCIQFRDKSLGLREITDGFDIHALENRGKSMTSQTQQSLAYQFGDKLRNQFDFLNMILVQQVMDGTIDSECWMTFLPIVGSFSSRRTTWESDEPLCLASVLRLDITPLVEVKDPDGWNSENKEIRKRADRELADERMAILYTLIGKLQNFIIFNKYPRLPMEGFRWAPRTYLGQLPFYFDGDMEPYEGRGSDLAIITKAGLRVTFPLITFDCHSSLVTTVFDRFFVDTVVGKPPGGSGGSGDNDIIGQYLVEPIKDSEGFTWTAGGSYRLIMQIPHENRVIGKTSLAVLGQLLPSEGTEPRIRHECMVRVTLLPLRYERSSDDLSIPTFVGMEDPGCSMVIV